MILKNINDYNINKIYTHIILNKTFNNKIKNVFIKFFVFIDFNVFNKIFIDKIFAQNLNFELIFIKFFKILKIFNKSIVVCNLIIYYVDVYFKIFVARKNVRLIRFYVIEFFY